MDENKKQQPVKTSYLFRLAENNRAAVFVAVFLSILSGLMMFVPYVMVYKTILFLFHGNGDFNSAIWYGVIAMAAILLRFVFQALSMALTHVGAYNLLYAVRKKLCGHIGKIELGFFTDNSTGKSKGTYGGRRTSGELFAHQIPDITVAMVVPLVVLVYLFTLNFVMALVLTLPIIITFAVQAIEMALAKPAMEEYPKILARSNSAIMQYVNGMPVMKAYNLTADSYQDYSRAVTDYRDLWKKVAKVLAPISGFSKVVIESGIFFTLPVGGLLYLSGRLALSSYLFFIIMSIVFLSSFNNLLNFAQIFSQISSGLGEMKEIMDIPETESENVQVEVGASHDIRFENVSFSYGEKEVLKTISIEMKSGSLTAFVGASGAGKTTAAQLIPVFGT